MDRHHAGFSTLSVEVLDQIFEPFYPAQYLNQKEWWNSDYNVNFVTDSFLQAQEFCIKLRSMTKRFYGLLTPRIYSHFVLPMYPAKAFLQRTQAAKYHPELIRVLFLRGEPHSDEDFPINLLHNFLSECSNLQTLHFLDPPDMFYQVTKSRIHRILGSASSLSSLTLRFTENWNVYFALGAVLIGLAHLAENLEHMDLEFFRESLLEDRPVSIPSLFPKLRMLLLQECRQPVAEKILSRISCGGKHSGCTPRTPCVPLRSLTLSYRENSSLPQEIPNFLKINNLGLTLTSLQIMVPSGYWSHQPSTLPLEILKLCPKLQKFVYLAPFPQAILLHLPDTLHILGVRIAKGRLDCINDPIQLVDLIQDRELKEIHVDVLLEAKQMKALREVCTAKGVTIVNYQNQAAKFSLRCPGFTW
ncbi:hypothetical protein BDN72DRAFT_884186 [Pluteus cervinus]|uniref:Uncharacterized protein n=1 Tax=Pluteus cervinus TaxID=181527 RepID=A0ACD2ZZ00_9AGAR|nr:hypothetical protein BDN72DRAFT_884186 [Pluteus cervinus]